MSPRIGFARQYVAELVKTLERLPLEPLDRVMQVLEDAYRRRAWVYLAGNGGSAATASHLANDLQWTLAQTGRPGFRTMALCDGMAALTAIANDSSFENVFSGRLRDIGQRADVLMAISGSGNSSNMVKCVEVARSLGMTSVGFLGKGGGKLRELVDVAVVVPSDDYGPIEDIHMILDHLLTAYLRMWLLKSDAEL